MAEVYVGETSSESSGSAEHASESSESESSESASERADGEKEEQESGTSHGSPPETGSRGSGLSVDHLARARGSGQSGVSVAERLSGSSASRSVLSSYAVARPTAEAERYHVDPCESDAHSADELEFDVDLAALAFHQREQEEPPEVPWQMDRLSADQVSTLELEKVCPPAWVQFAARCHNGK